MEAEGKPLPKSIPSSNILKEEIEKISKDLDRMEVNRTTEFPFSGVVIISYNYER